MDDRITMRVRDDGIGIQTGEFDKPGALGLLEIRERFAAQAGCMTRPADPMAVSLAAASNFSITIRPARHPAMIADIQEEDSTVWQRWQRSSFRCASSALP